MKKKWQMGRWQMAKGGEGAGEAQRGRGTEGWWRRGVVRIGACVAAGAVLTTLVGAASLLYAPMTVKGRGLFASMSLEGHAPGSVVFESGQVYHGIGIHMTADSWWWIPSETPALGEPSHVTGASMPTFSVGWPLLAFASAPAPFPKATSYAEFQAARKHAYAVTTTSAAPDFVRAQPHRVVPGRILPVGFAVNTALFAAVAGAVLLAPGAVRRGLRRRGGRCVGCGYPLTGGERCPECGAWLGGAVVARKHRPLKAAVGGTVGGAIEAASELLFAICSFAMSTRRAQS